MAARPFAIVIYGATGFTGGLVAEYLAARPGALRFAIAGRNESKLRAVGERLFAINPALRGSLGILVDTNGLNGVVKQAQVAISTVGPFILHGEPVLRACVEEGTHYIDSTGEFPWVKAMDIKYGDAARAKGLLVVPMCGYDSVPSDLGTFLAVRKARTQLGNGVGLKTVRTYAAAGGLPSGGTLASAVAAVRKATNHIGPLALTPVGMSGVDARRIVDAGAPRNLLPGWAAQVRKWQCFFFMSAVNSGAGCVIRRVCARLS
jgi:short subunit dehydrogenase-like uncharacterized protein